MRLLHTADWHLGHSLHDRPREHEHAAFLGWLLGELKRQDVDVLVVAGDIFDTATPPAAAQAQWHQFLVDAWREIDHLQVVAIAGNHDSAARLEAAGPLLRPLKRLHVVGRPMKERMLIELPGRGDDAGAWVAAVPFLRPSDLPLGVAHADGVAQVYGELVRAARDQQKDGQALIALGHCYLTGGAPSELSERKLQVGHQDALPADLFPSELDYVALGHLHLAQKVGRREHIRYAGAPLPFDIAERDYPHAVSLVEFSHGRLSGVSQLRTPRTVELLRMPEDGAMPLPELLAELRRLPPRTPEHDDTRLPLLELHVALTGPEPTLRAQVGKTLEDRAVRWVKLRVHTLGDGGTLADAQTRRLEDLQPADVFCQRWQQQFGEAPDAQHAAAFNQLTSWAQDPAQAAAERAGRPVAWR